MENGNPPKNWLELRCWNPLYKIYAVYCNVENTDALWDNLEGFDAIGGVWFERRCYKTEEHPPFGLILVHVPKWKSENAEAAFDNYVRRQEWETPGFREIMTEDCQKIFE